MDYIRVVADLKVIRSDVQKSGVQSDDIVPKSYESMGS